MSDFSNIAATFAEAAQMIREGSATLGICDAFGIIEDCRQALLPYREDYHSPITFRTIDLAAEKLRSVTALDLAGPRDKHFRRFYIFTEDAQGVMESCFRESQREPMAVVFARWARFFAERGRKRLRSRHGPATVQTQPASNFGSAKELAEQIGQPKRTVESWLRRYRVKYPDCFEKTESPRRCEARYLYRADDVLPALLLHFQTQN